MENNINFNPQYMTSSQLQFPTQERGRFSRTARTLIMTDYCDEVFLTRPVSAKSVTGLSSIIDFFHGVAHSISAYKKSYVQNIKHTYEHKIYFAIIEKSIFGKNSIDSVTHDMDKMIMYLLGFPKEFVSKFHRKHSAHHIQSGKIMNLHSMLCDNIASSPEFKPEKKQSLKDYYRSSQELQNVKGFGEILDRFSYGENLNFDEIKALKEINYKGFKGFKQGMKRVIKILIKR